MPKANSIALRLVASAALWIAAALLVGGLLLSNLFRGSVERAFDDRLLVLLNSLIAVTDIVEGALVQERSPGEPRFQRPYSGWYWEVRGEGQTFGKRVCGIRTVMTTGQGVTLAASLVRNIARLVDNVPALWLIPTLGEGRRRLGDILGGTFVIQTADRAVRHPRLEWPAETYADDLGTDEAADELAEAVARLGL